MSNNLVAYDNVNLVAVGGNILGSGLPIKTGRTTLIKQYSFSRPADTVDYSVGDAVSDSATSPTLQYFDFSEYTVDSEVSIRIESVYVIVSGVYQQLPLFNLFLSILQYAPTNDNEELSIPYSAVSSGWFSHIILTDRGYTDNIAVNYSHRVGDIITIPPGDGKLYCSMQSAGAYSQVSSSQYTVKIISSLL